MIEPVITKRGTKYRVSCHDSENPTAPVTLLVEGRWSCPFQLQDYLTADECMTLAAQLSMVAIQSEPGAYETRMAELVVALKRYPHAVPQDEPE